MFVAGTPLRDEPIQITADASSRAWFVEVEPGVDLSVGDDVEVGWTITPEFVAQHGMTDVWGPFNDTWQTFFQRTVVSIERGAGADRVWLDIPLRYPIQTRDGPSIHRVTGLLREFGIESLGLANAVDRESAWAHDRVSVLQLVDLVDCWVRDVHSFAPPSAADGDDDAPHLQSGGIRIEASKRVTVQDTHLASAQNRGGGGNGYLFEIRRSNEILTRDCTARAGRHNFIQNWGFGTSGCVWLRIHSSDGRGQTTMDGGVFTTGLSEFHHSLATANLIDASIIDDGWGAVNRTHWSSGAGHSASENVAWNTTGRGVLRWYNFGHGYVIGTGPAIDVATTIVLPNSGGTEPEDYTEGLGRGELLQPVSLYEDQRALRLAR
ncbi:MAG: hypothetical protein ACJAYU_005341 [Bradymonadia bacterium]|jgi:hypothetical protein